MRLRLLIAAALLGPLVWLFGRALVTDQMFVFRDAAHYYHPLYQMVARQWAAGGVPLWNPYDNLGQPLLADATAAVLYPGKLIFALPLGYDGCYKLYIVGHVVLAAAAAFLAARGFARSAPAAALAALCYAFSGAVLFQYCNVIFLVGAAWLPAAALTIDRTLTRRSWQWALAAGAVMAMMVLGGDPQTAYHTGLAAALYAVVLWRLNGRERPAAGGFARCAKNRIALLATIAGVLFVLCAVQILPSAQWTQRSTRAAFDTPRSVYELFSDSGGCDQREAMDGYAFLLGKTAAGHHTQSYEFSVGPWHLAGYIWPNLFGRVFPVHTRWIRALPAEGRTWTPTLYMGLLPLLLGLTQWQLFRVGRAKLPPSRNTERTPRLDQQSGTTALPSATRNSARREPRPREARTVWLSWLVLLALLAGFGWYSLGWISSEVYYAICGVGADPPPWGWPFGGAYWLLQTLLPGYVYFRYPAKWLVFVSLGLSLLAAQGFDEMLRGSVARVRRLLFVVIAATLGALALAVALIYVWPVWSQLAEIVPNDALFGPFDANGGAWSILGALLHTLVVAAALWLLIRAGKSTQNASADETGRILPRWRVGLVLLVAAADVAVAQRNLVPTAPAAGWHAKPEQARVAPPRAAEMDDDPPPRVYRWPDVMPLRWANTSSPDRQIEAQRWDRRTLHPNYHLLSGIELVNSTRSMRSADHAAFLASIPRGATKIRGVSSPDTTRLREINARLLIPGEVPAEYQWAGIVAGAAAAGGKPHPRAWVVHNVDVLPPLQSHSPRSIRQRTTRALFPGERRNLELSAVVETNDPPPGVAPPGLLFPDDATCEFLRYEAEHVELLATLAQAGLVVLSDSYYPGWTCEVTNLETGETERRPILRTNRVMRGVWLPAGRYRVVYRYRPTPFYAGAIISGAGWAMLLLVAGIFAAKRLRRRRSRS